MTWHSPAAFLLILLVAAAAIYYWFRRQAKEAFVQYSSVSALKHLGKSWRMQLAWMPLAMKAVALSLVAVAIARPQTASTLIKRNVEGIDIIIALDISDSMLIEDMKPLNRLEAAKDTIKKFVKGRVSDRIGLVVFAGESFTMIPLTLDYDMLISRVEEITTAQQARIKDGTALGVGLANGAARLRESTAKSRVMIFLTDGENNSGTIDPETGLEIAKGYGIKIYSIGLGKSGPTRIPVFQKDIFGNRVKTYQPFESTVNDELLGKMASQTGGKYFRATAENSLKDVFAEIDRLEKTKIDVNKFLRFDERYTNVLIAALALYLLSLLLPYTLLRRVP